jgi:rRNA pseudouridine-1189 N-methylase Emg1 (Nep1/Mra1 family)
VDIVKKEAGPDFRHVIIVLHENGERSNAFEMMSEMEDGLHLVCLIGGFPSGDFRSDISFVDRKVSLHEKQLKAISIEMELISAFNNSKFRGIRTSEEA